MPATKDFFISYTSSDQAWAEWIAWTLEQAEYKCILQAWDFVPGQDFMQQMRQAIDSSAQMVAVLSDEYLRSAYASAELNAALVRDPLGANRTLVPIRVRPCTLGGILEGRIYIDLTGKDMDRARRDLVQGVAAARLGRRPDPDEAHFTQPPRFPGVEGTALALPADAPKTVTEPVVSILYLGSETGAGLNLKGQAKQIERAIRASSSVAQLKLDAVFDVTTENIFEILNAHRPSIVHFAGKQNGGNVVVRTGSGSVTTISDLALAGLLQNVDSTVVLAIVDTCKSLRCARAITDVVDFAVGVAGDIYDTDAIHFYNVFYGALAAGKSVAAASGQATAALRFKKVAAEEIPQLCIRNGVDPKSFRFVRKR